MASNSFSTNKAPGEMPAPIKQAPAPTGQTDRVAKPFPETKQASLVPGTPGPAAPAGPQLDEFGRDMSSIANMRNPLAAVGDFNQRKANAMGTYPQAGGVQGLPPQSPAFPQHGGGFMYPGPPQQGDPFTPAPPVRQAPNGLDPQGGGMFPNTNRQPQQPSQGDFAPPQPMGPPPGMQQMFQQPGFMQWLMRMFQQQGGGGSGMNPAGSPPQLQTGPMTQGPPR
jgi:hypothetical protein